MDQFMSWPAAMPILEGIVFVAIWIAATVSISRMTGWHRLAEKYAMAEMPDIRFARAVHVYWGSVMLSGNIYTVGADREALYLGVLFPFRAGHPPLRIPWRDIKAQRVKRLFLPRVSLAFGGGLSRPFEISDRVAERLGTDSSGALVY